MIFECPCVCGELSDFAIQTPTNSFVIHFQRERLPGSERKKKKSKSKKDPNAPKRPQSAYFLWFNANREEMKKENPEMGITDLSRRAGELWKQVEDKTVSLMGGVELRQQKPCL